MSIPIDLESAQVQLVEREAEIARMTCILRTFLENGIGELRVEEAHQWTPEEFHKYLVSVDQMIRTMAAHGLGQITHAQMFVGLFALVAPKADACLQRSAEDLSERDYDAILASKKGAA